MNRMGNTWSCDGDWFVGTESQSRFNFQRLEEEIWGKGGLRGDIKKWIILACPKRLSITMRKLQSPWASVEPSHP